MQPDHGELLDQLLDPTNDRAWKVAAGYILSDVHSQTRKTNGRVTKLERFMWLCIGGLAVISAIVVPLFLGAVQQ